MEKLTPESLWSLEEYDRRREAFRAEVRAHKQRRQLALGAHLRLLFEDATTIRYQVQEMLRIEKIFQAAGIAEELAAYNPLIPDGRNWKATLMIEYDRPSERRRALETLVGLERRVWVRVAGCAPVWAIADEDLDRSEPDKTSAVHFLRFELTPEMVTALEAGASLAAGVDHPAYRATLDPLPGPLRDALAGDIQPLN